MYASYWFCLTTTDGKQKYSLKIVQQVLLVSGPAGKEFRSPHAILTTSKSLKNKKLLVDLSEK